MQGEGAEVLAQTINGLNQTIVYESDELQSFSGFILIRSNVFILITRVADPLLPMLQNQPR